MATGFSRRLRFLTAIFRSFWVWVMAQAIGWLLILSGMYVASILFDGMLASRGSEEALSWFWYVACLAGAFAATLALIFVVGMFVHGIRIARWIRKPVPATAHEQAESSADTEERSERVTSAKTSRGRKRLVAAFIGVLLALSLVIAFDPTHFVWGLLTGQHFFRARPTSYWRKVFREAPNGEVGQELRDQFRANSNGAEGVLRQCSRDGDRMVRRVAVQLVPIVGHGVGILIDALKDEDVEVRINALISLSKMGYEGSLAEKEVETLARLSPVATKDDEDVRDIARYALWCISPDRARTLLEWKELVRRDLNFAVAFPGKPRIESNPPTVKGPLLNRVIMFRMTAIKTAAVALVVIDYNSDAPILAAPLAQQYDELVDEIISNRHSKLIQGKIIHESDVKQGGIVGRAVYAELTTSDGSILKLNVRFFIVKQRVYRLVVSRIEGTPIHSNWIEHFFNSFRILPSENKR